MNLHPAWHIPYPELVQRLHEEVEKGNIVCQEREDGLALYCYSRQCVYEHNWNETTQVARGLILDRKNRRIAATPFPKFFNYGERSNEIPQGPFQTFDKLDGSLIIAFHHDGQWNTATKGSFYSEQAQWAREKLKDYEYWLSTEYTYLFEAVYQSNRIVVRYDYEDLVFLGAYSNRNGTEVPYADFYDTPMPIATQHSFDSVHHVASKASMLSAQEEGYVLRFDNGERLKVKGNEYRRIHALVSNLKPLTIWEAMRDSCDLEAMKKELPEEFWSDFDQIVKLLENKIAVIMYEVAKGRAATDGLTDKEVGLSLASFKEPYRKFLFPARRGGLLSLLEGKTRRALFEEIRPKANRLDGYVPSYAVSKVQDDA